MAITITAELIQIGMFYSLLKVARLHIEILFIKQGLQHLLAAKIMD